MARTATGRALTEAHRLAQIALSKGTVAQFLAVWDLLDKDALRESFPAYYRAAKAIVDANRRRSAALAAAYLENFRRVEGARGPFTPVLAGDADDAPTMTSLYVTGPVAIERAQRNGKPPEETSKAAFVLSVGAITRLALNGGRETLYASTEADHEATGYRRVTAGSTCSFCRDLAALGPVRKSLGANFRAHDHCGCTAEPVYDEIFD